MISLTQVGVDASMKLRHDQRRQRGFYPQQLDQADDRTKQGTGDKKPAQPIDERFNAEQLPQPERKDREDGGPQHIQRPQQVELRINGPSEADLQNHEQGEAQKHEA